MHFLSWDDFFGGEFFFSRGPLGAKDVLSNFGQQFSSLQKIRVWSEVGVGTPKQTDLPYNEAAATYRNKEERVRSTCFIPI